MEGGPDAYIGEIRSISNCLGDLGLHAENIVSHVTGLKKNRLCAKLNTFVDGRVLDDNSVVLAEYEKGAVAQFLISYVAIGHIYRSFFDDLTGQGIQQAESGYRYQTITDGADSLYFLEKAVESSKNDSVWIDF